MYVVLSLLFHTTLRMPVYDRHHSNTNKQKKDEQNNPFQGFFSPPLIRERAEVQTVRCVLLKLFLKVIIQYFDLSGFCVFVNFPNSELIIHLMVFDFFIPFILFPSTRLKYPRFLLPKSPRLLMTLNNILNQVQSFHVKCCFIYIWEY